jgi:hypothetical protein
MTDENEPMNGVSTPSAPPSTGGKRKANNRGGTAKKAKAAQQDKMRFNAKLVVLSDHERRTKKCDKCAREFSKHAHLKEHHVSQKYLNGNCDTKVHGTTVAKRPTLKSTRAKAKVAAPEKSVEEQMNAITALMSKAKGKTFEKQAVKQARLTQARTELFGCFVQQAMFGC